jgi:hypothetical protein
MDDYMDHLLDTGQDGKATQFIKRIYTFTEVREKIAAPPTTDVTTTTVRAGSFKGDELITNNKGAGTKITLEVGKLNSATTSVPKIQSASSRLIGWNLESEVRVGYAVPDDIRIRNVIPPPPPDPFDLSNPTPVPDPVKPVGPPKPPPVPPHVRPFKPTPKKSVRFSSDLITGPTPSGGGGVPRGKGFRLPKIPDPPDVPPVKITTKIFKYGGPALGIVGVGAEIYGIVMTIIEIKELLKAPPAEVDCSDINARNDY